MKRGILEKDYRWQELRGVAIISVIIIHCQNGVNSSLFWKDFWLFERAILNFPVALFLFMSGYFAYDKDLRTSEFLRKRIKKLFVPYVFWSLIYITIDCVAGLVSGGR